MSLDEGDTLVAVKRVAKEDAAVKPAEDAGGVNWSAEVHLSFPRCGVEFPIGAFTDPKQQQKRR